MPEPTAESPSTAASPPSRLERWGVGVFQRLSSSRPSVAPDDHVHILNPAEKRRLRAIEGWAIFRASFAGALSAVVAAVAEILAQPMLPESGATWGDRAAYWGVVLGVGGFAALVEIAFLYWDALRTVHGISQAAGLDLRRREGDAGEQIVDLTRAALEIPNPPAPYLGVDPYRGASRLALLLFTVGYKLKISVTNFVLKMLVRRAAGRTVLRAWIPFVAVPVTAVWNGLVMWWILHQARIRCMAHSAVYEHVGTLLKDVPELSVAGREAVLRAVASTIVRSRDLHPGLRKLLQHTYDRLERPTVEELDDPRRFLDALPPLREDEQTVALRFLTLGAIIDGRISRRERALLLDAHGACGRELDLAHLKRLQRGFLRGNDVVI